MPATSVLQVLRTIKDRASISRTDLQQLTGLSWGTITNCTRELLGRNFIREQGAQSPRAGRKPMRLVLNPLNHCIVGVDIAPDVVRCLMLNIAGETLYYEESRGASHGEPQAAIDDVSLLISKGLNLHQDRICLGIGVAVPGALDVTRGLVRFA